MDDGAGITFYYFDTNPQWVSSVKINLHCSYDIRGTIGPFDLLTARIKGASITQRGYFDRQPDHAREWAIGGGFVLTCTRGNYVEMYWNPNELAPCFQRFMENWGCIMPDTGRGFVEPLSETVQKSVEIGGKPQSRGPMYQGDS